MNTTIVTTKLTQLTRPPLEITSAESYPLMTMKYSFKIFFPSCLMTLELKQKNHSYSFFPLLRMLTKLFRSFYKLLNIHWYNSQVTWYRKLYRLNTVWYGTIIKFRVGTTFIFRQEESFSWEHWKWVYRTSILQVSSCISRRNPRRWYINWASSRQGKIQIHHPYHSIVLLNSDLKKGSAFYTYQVYKVFLRR